VSFDMADAPGLGPLSMHDLLGQQQARVWYAEIIMLFSMDLVGDTVTQKDFAWVQWYEPFGGTAAGSGRRHVDPDFPIWLEEYFPRIYLPEHTRQTGASYEIIVVQDIIGPAPITDDLSVMHYDPEDEAR
jgi:hypothetical protein